MELRVSPAKPDRHLLLVGGGHAHLQVLKNWNAWRPANARVTLISNRPHTIYSGMLPGHLAGWYTRDEIQVNLPEYCSRTGAKFHLGHAVSVDCEKRMLRLDGGDEVAFDVVSFDIGSRSAPFAGDRAAIFPLKPVPDFADHWMTLLEQLKNWRKARSPQIAMVGGGAAGFEIAMVLARLTETFQPSPEITIWEMGDLLNGHGRLARRFAIKELGRQDVRLRTGVRVTELRDGKLKVESVDLRAGGGRGHARTAEETCDFLILASEAFGPDVFKTSGLEVDGKGFLKVSETLQSVSYPFVFGAGDCISFPKPLAKNGVFAIREADTLRRNLKYALEGNSNYVRYHPQMKTLALMITGEQKAIASWGPLSWQGAAIWRWKDRIDRGFMESLKK